MSAVAPSIMDQISPWGAFDKAWTLGMGYSADHFTYDDGETPMSSLREVAFTICWYLVLVFGGRELMRNRKPMKLNALFKLHNFCLTLASGLLLLLFAEQLLPTLWRHGFYQNICGADGWTRPLVALYYVSTLSRDCRAASGFLHLLGQLHSQVH